MLADLEQQAASAREAWRVHSADLTQVLRLDPRAVVIPQEHDHLQITLIDPARPLDDLIPIGLLNRPELASHRALVLAAEARLRREKMRPLLPSVMINGFQASGGMLLQRGSSASAPTAASTSGPAASIRAFSSSGSSKRSGSEISHASRSSAGSSRTPSSSCPRPRTGSRRR